MTFASLVKACTHADPQKRPTAQEVCDVAETCLVDYDVSPAAIAGAQQRAVMYYRETKALREELNDKEREIKKLKAMLKESGRNVSRLTQQVEELSQPRAGANRRPARSTRKENDLADETLGIVECATLSDDDDDY